MTRTEARGADRHDLIVVAVNDQRRHVELLEVFGKVRLGKRFYAVEGVLVASAHPLKPERVNHSLRDLGTWPVGTKERITGEILVELRAVGEGPAADLSGRLAGTR